MIGTARECWSCQSSNTGVGGSEKEDRNLWEVAGWTIGSASRRRDFRTLGIPNVEVTQGIERPRGEVSGLINCFEHE